MTLDIPAWAAVCIVALAVYFVLSLTRVDITIEK
jgi:hypothetical protein